MFRNPEFVPAREHLAILEARKRTAYDPSHSGPKVSPHSVKGVTENIAEKAVEALLSQLPSHRRWVNANAIKKNQPGYDYLVDNRIKIQVKGTDAVEQVGWAMKPDARHKSMDFDFLVFVHVGACLSTNFGRFAQYQWPVQPCVGLYVIPNATIQAWIAKPRYLNTGRVELYWNRRQFPEKSRQHTGQTREILDYKDAYAALGDAISSA